MTLVTKTNFLYNSCVTKIMVWLETDNLHSHPIKFYIAYNIERYWALTSIQKKSIQVIVVPFERSDRSNLMQPKQLESAIRNNLDVIRKLRQTLHRRLSKRLYDPVSATKARRCCNSSSTGHLYVWSIGLSMRRSLRSLAGTDHEKASRGL